MQGELRYQEPMAKHTSWQVGGIADRFYRPAGIDDLAIFLHSLAITEPLCWIGLGSNLLIRDGGIRGTVIYTQGCLQALTQTSAVTIRAEAGVSCAQLARFSARLGLTGAEFLAGIPGTIGGALAMNAGCCNSQTWQWIIAVECINRQGEITLNKPSDYQISYRKVQKLNNNEAWFTAGHFKLLPGNKTTSLAMIRQLLAHRAATQPTGEPSCGSVFRNPPGDYAGRLIEGCGLKGFKLGNAAVSTKHANFIVNLGNATAKDIEALISLVLDKVYDHYKIRLIPEVHIIGEGS